jgi:hypothetical protein
MCCWTQPSLPDRRRWEGLAAIVRYSQYSLDYDEIREIKLYSLDDDEIKRKKLNEAIDGFFWSHPNLPG